VGRAYLTNWGKGGHTCSPAGCHPGGCRCSVVRPAEAKHVPSAANSCEVAAAARYTKKWAKQRVGEEIADVGFTPLLIVLERMVLWEDQRRSTCLFEIPILYSIVFRNDGTGNYRSRL
jgi:hypothetical protein